MNRMLRMKSKMADGEVSAADSTTSLQGKKSGYTFGQNETLLLISLYQKSKENCCDNGWNGSLFVGRHICYAMFTRPEPTGVFLCRQSELFLAFHTNHSYSRIVDKKRALILVNLEGLNNPRKYFRPQGIDLSEVSYIYALAHQGYRLLAISDRNRLSI